MGRVRLPGPHRVHAKFSRPLPPSSTPASQATQQLLPYPPAGWHSSGRYYPSCSAQPTLAASSPPPSRLSFPDAQSDHRLLVVLAAQPRVAMNILNQPINPGGHPVFPAAKESGHLMPASVRFDGVQAPQPSTAAAGRPRWQAQTLRRASSYVGAEHDGTTASVPVPVPVPVPGAALAPVPFKPITLDFLRSLVDANCSMTSVVADAEATAPPPPQMVALRVVVTSALELDARQTELIARKMRRLTGFVNLKVENVVDTSLIAGFVVCYGTDESHVIDLSVKAQLAALKNRVDSIDQTVHAHGHPHHC